MSAQRQTSCLVAIVLLASLPRCFGQPIEISAGSIVEGIRLSAGESLEIPGRLVWTDFDEAREFYQSKPVVVTKEFSIDNDATLVMRVRHLHKSALGRAEALVVSEIQFLAGVSVDLGGTLRIEGIPSDVGEFRFLSWASPFQPVSRFEFLDLPFGVWDVSRLYVDGSLTLLDRFNSRFGDLNHDDNLSAYDFDKLALAIRLGGNGCDAGVVCASNRDFDLDANRQLDERDLQVWILRAAGSIPGDANLDGKVEFDDFASLSSSFNQPSGWAGGDFDGSGITDFDDFVILANNFGKEAVGAVPEPSAKLSITVGATTILPFRRRRKCFLR